MMKLKDAEKFHITVPDGQYDIERTTVCHVIENASNEEAVQQHWFSYYDNLMKTPK